jgi:hypothetical protein
MNFVFEREDKNLITCTDRNRSGIGRVTPSPMIQALIRYARNKYHFSNLDLTQVKWSHNPAEFDRYIISLGVAHHPDDWAGVDQKNTGNVAARYPERHSLFYFLKPQYLTDLQAGRAFLLLDQCHEGYHVPWIYEWFHQGCSELGINPEQMIYVTGDLDVTKKYQEWCQGRDLPGYICTVGHPHFESIIYEQSLNRVRIDKYPAFPTVAEQLEYKAQNLESIRVYNALQKRPRAHRAWLFLRLVQQGLIHDGINSMNALSRENCYYMDRFMSEQEYAMISPFLPMLPPSTGATEQELEAFANVDSGKYQLRFNEDICLDSWVSVISEASFSDDQCFISEKTFKPLIVGHPFIVFGNPNSLQYLRDMGYKTFDPWIDESYDRLPAWERLEAILVAINKIKMLDPQQRLQWFGELQPILEHNQQVMKANWTQSLPDSYTKILRHYEANRVLQTS